MKRNSANYVLVDSYSKTYFRKKEIQFLYSSDN